LFSSDNWQPKDYRSIFTNYIEGDKSEIKSIIKSAVLYRFGPQELLQVPAHEFGRTAIIVAGNVVPSSS
jgi:hypothetical protein